MTCLCIGLEIGMGHFLCVILFEDIDKVVSAYVNANASAIDKMIAKAKAM